MTEPEKPVVSPANLSARLFGERLKALRKEIELKQSVLARSTGISEDTLSRIERGLLSPNLDILRLIAERLEMPLGELIDFQDAPKARATINQQLAAHILYLKTKTQDEARAAIKVCKLFLDQARALNQKPRKIR